MKFYLAVISTFLSLNAMADIKQDITDFLNTFPSKMSCQGTEINFIRDMRTDMPEKMTITITDKETDHPMIDVVVPSASKPTHKHFIIGNGYGGSDEQSGSHSYYFLEDRGKKSVYYLPVINSGDPVDIQFFLRVRDSGGLVSFSNTRVCPRTHTCFEFSDCTAE